MSGLIHESGSLDWMCLPRPDGEPIFGRLLDQNGGHFSISLADAGILSSEQAYVENTNILVTEIEGSRGGNIRITDFCPRFEQYGRMFRPLTLIRIVEPLEASSSVQIDCRPVNGWNKTPLHAVRGNSHIRFDLGESSLRLTTNMALTYLTERTPFHLKEKIYFALTWESPIEEELSTVCERFLLQTRDYWRTWVKHCTIPFQFQNEVIRSALTLKLHCYEDTGAILAATSTSLPEELGSHRNWDYRYCWLRDAYFTLSALHNVGHFEEMEGFLKFLLDIAHKQESSQERLSPVYTLSRDLPIPEIEHSNWAGYKESKPVRSNNQAAEQTQNDVYGEMILTLAPIFFDQRFSHLRVKEHEDLLGHLGFLASKAISKPDAGLWEFRQGWKEHTFTNFMSWAGLERIERIQKLGFLRNLRFDVSAETLRARSAVEAAAKEGILRNGPHDSSLDASLSLLPVLRFPNTALSQNTVEQLHKNLRLYETHPCHFYRYVREDDFGSPQSAFVVCSFWMAQAYSHLGQNEKAKLILENAIKSANHLGLFSEHFDPAAIIQLGNFPQAYSHVGLINAAFAVSPRWSDVL